MTWRIYCPECSKTDPLAWPQQHLSKEAAQQAREEHKAEAGHWCALRAVSPGRPRGTKDGVPRRADGEGPRQSGTKDLPNLNDAEPSKMLKQEMFEMAGLTRRLRRLLVQEIRKAEKSLAASDESTSPLTLAQRLEICKALADIHDRALAGASGAARVVLSAEKAKSPAEKVDRVDLEDLLGS